MKETYCIPSGDSVMVLSAIEYSKQIEHLCIHPSILRDI